MPGFTMGADSSSVKRYLLFVSLPYAFPVLRPIQDVIRQRNDCRVAWFVDEPYAKFLRDDEVRLASVDEVLAFDPMAVLVVDNKVYDFFPGIKVQLFHGFNIFKRVEHGRSTHFAIRGLFDLYCTQGPNTTGEFRRLADIKGYFKVYETGWPKVDALFNGSSADLPSFPNDSWPCILYASTFSRHITSTPFLFDEIARLISSQPWNWIITFHPKMDLETVNRYKALAKFPNVFFYEGDDNVPLLKRADIMVSDSSSIIVEFQMLGKPVVTFKNTHSGSHLIDIDDPSLLLSAIIRALDPPARLLDSIRAYTNLLNPYRDGRSSERVLDAIDWFLANFKGHLRHKPLNLIRKLQLRCRLGFFRL